MNLMKAAGFNQYGSADVLEIADVKRPSITDDAENEEVVIVKVHAASLNPMDYLTEVTAVCSTTNLAWVKALGADRVIDNTQEDFTKSGKKYDLILDTVGKRTFFACKRALSEHGIYITEHLLYPKYHILQLLPDLFIGKKRAKLHFAQANAQDLDFLGNLIATEQIKPVIVIRTVVNPIDKSRS